MVEFILLLHLVKNTKKLLLIFANMVFTFIHFLWIFLNFFLKKTSNTVPELQNIPDKYIFEPYNAPDSVQKSSNCIIGTGWYFVGFFIFLCNLFSSPKTEDYPTPIVDHATARKQNLEKMSQAYSDASKKSMYSSNVPYNQKYTDDADTDAQRNALKQYASQWMDWRFYCWLSYFLFDLLFGKFNFKKKRLRGVDHFIRIYIGTLFKSIVES